MKKALLLIGLSLLFFCPAVFADNDVSIETEVTTTAVVKGDYTPQLIEKIKKERNTIYNALNLTPAQIKQKDEIEVRRYKDLEPEIKKFCISKQNLKDISEDKNAGKDKLTSAQKSLEDAKKGIKNISAKYDKEFKKVLTSEQKSKYEMIRKLKKADLKQSEEKKPKKEPALKPFGVPITQAEYTEQQKHKKKSAKQVDEK